MDGASVFIFSAIFQEVGTFYLAFDTNAFTLRFTGDVVLVSPANFNVVAPDSEEPIEDLLFPNVRSTSEVPSEIAFYVNERVGASTEGSKMIRIKAGGVEVAIASGQSDRVYVLAPDQLCPWIRQPIWHTGAKCPSLWTKAAFWTWKGMKLV